MHAWDGRGGHHNTGNSASLNHKLLPWGENQEFCQFMEHDTDPQHLEKAALGISASISFLVPTLKCLIRSFL